MFGLSRLLKLAGSLAWNLNGNWRKTNTQPIRRRPLHLESLEERTVPTLLGQSLYPADNPWNQNIASAPVAANSGAIMSHIGASISVHPDWGNSDPANGTAPLYGIPVNVVHGNTAPRVSFSIDSYASESDIIAVPMPTNPVIEGDYQNGPNLNGPGYGSNQRGDSHLLVWDMDNNVVYELYGVARPNDAVTFSGGSTGGIWHAAQETVWDLKTNTYRTLGYTSADAAGLSILAGLARPDEGLPTAQGGQGVINHALRFTLPSGDVNPQYMYPAAHMVYTTASSSNLPFGGRLRLKNNATVNATIATLGPQAQILARTMQQYGLILADIGAPMYVTGASGAPNSSNQTQFVWNMDDVLGLQAIKSGDFEVVDLTPRVTGLSASSGASGTTVTITGQNFSGAAGNLSVLFGSTPSSSVTYVDDTHVRAVVPTGAGTVHVQVKSGMNATDFETPTHNVTNPMFGYGMSAATSTDSFTFGATQTISGAASTASFASATVVSGATDVLTINVKDTTGAAVGGLASSAFSFSWSGGTSTGSFSSVNATATQGTYTATFTGFLAGTSNTLTITVGGVTLAVQPTITVNAGAINATTSAVSFATSAVTVGSGDLLTLVIKDAAGNAVTGLSSAAFGLSLSGGSTSGSFNAVTETTTPGRYQANFVASVTGSASTLTASVNGVTLAQHPTVMATSSTTFSDDFTTASGGQDLNGLWTTQLGNFRVDTSVATATGVGATNLATAIGVNSADEAVKAIVTAQPGQTAGLVARYIGPGDQNMYLGQVVASNGKFTANIYRNLNGTWTKLFSKTYYGTVVDANLEFDVVGSSLRLFLNGSIVAYANDTTLTAPGSVGMRFMTGTVAKSFSAVPLPLQNSASPTTFSDNFANPGNNQQLSNYWLNLAGNFQVDSTAHTATGLTALNLATVNGIVSSDESVSATISLAANQTAGLVARHTGPGDRNMYLGVISAGNSSFTATLSRNVNGTWTQLFSKSYSGAVSNDVLEFDVVGSSLRLFLDGTIVAYANDGMLTTPGTVGMRTRSGATMNNFSASSLATANQSLPFADGFSASGPNGQLGSAWLNRVGNIGIVNGETRGVASTNLATVNGVFATDATVQADIRLTASGQSAGVVARYVGSGDQNMYYARIIQTSSTSYSAQLLVNVAGRWTTLRSQSVATGNGALKLVISGSNMTVSFGGISLFTVVDSSITAAGGFGLRLQSGGTADNFSIS